MLILHQKFAARKIIMQISLTAVITEAPDYLLELMNDKNREICKFCAKTLDAMAVCFNENLNTNVQCLHVCIFPPSTLVSL